MFDYKKIMRKEKNTRGNKFLMFDFTIKKKKI